MSDASASPATVAGFTVGQQVWFIRRGLVLCGIIQAFWPWRTNPDSYSAELRLVDDLTVSVAPDDLYSGEVPALECLLEETQRHAAYLKARLKELAKATTKKAAAAAQEGAA